MEQLMTNRERMSALADGRLRDAELEHALRAVHEDAGAREAWHEYHLVGDVLRSRELASGPLDARLVEQVRAAVAGEAVVARMESAPPRAANDAVWGWKLAAGFASVAALAAIGWNVVGTAWSPPTPVIARAAESPASVASADQQAMIRDPRLDELLAAHRQSGGISALQMPAGFLRNATYEAPGR